MIPYASPPDCTLPPRIVERLPRPYADPCSAYPSLRLDARSPPTVRARGTLNTGPVAWLGSPVYGRTVGSARFGRWVGAQPLLSSGCGCVGPLPG